MELLSLLAGAVVTVACILLASWIFWPQLWLGAWRSLRLLRDAMYRHRHLSRKPIFSVLDRLLERASATPHKLFLTFEDDSWTYGEFVRDVARTAHALQEFGGVRPGDTVALLMENEPAFLFVLFACTSLACPAILMNTNLRGRMLLHCLTTSKAQFLVTGSGPLLVAVEEMSVEMNELQIRPLAMGDATPGTAVPSLASTFREAPCNLPAASVRAHITAKDAFIYIYTSGTTGLPKAVKVSHTRAWSGNFNYLMSGVRAEDVVYIFLPLYHSSAIMAAFIGSLDIGARLVLRRKFSASHFWGDCRRHGVTVFQYVGEICRYLLSQPKNELDRVHSVRMAVGNGMRADVWARFLERHGDVRFCELYGATEGNVGFVNVDGKLGACGRDLPFLRLLIKYVLVKYDHEKDGPVRDDKGFCIPLPRGQPGLLVAPISKHMPFDGYLGNAEFTQRKVLHNVCMHGDRYFNSGDIMRIDEEGFIYFIDRVGDTFRWKGENVSTMEVADTLSDLDFIKEVTVYGVTIPNNEGRAGMAAVILEEGHSLDGPELYRHVVGHLPTYARPYFIRLQEALELTSTFKQIKTHLLQEGFNPALTRAPLFYLDNAACSYTPLTRQIYEGIVSGKVKL
ncbi:long-chain fatty acid transport protein 2-like [Lampetra fluviatilis]